VAGITGPPGAGKSTLVSALTRHLRGSGERVAVLAVDPSSPYTGGALLGDRIRMSEHLGDEGVFIRSLASRGHPGGLALAVPLAARVLLHQGFSWVLIETVGTGQGDVDIARYADTTIVVQAPGLGDDMQAGKSGILEIADVLAVNKADQSGAKETVRDLATSLHAGRKQAWRVPVVATQATTGDGIQALHAAVTAHRTFLTESGELDRRRRDRQVAEWRDRCEMLARQEVERALASPPGLRLAAQVADGSSSPADAAKLFIGNVLGSLAAEPGDI
jgi:LAO/AO transport system kinase